MDKTQLKSLLVAAARPQDYPGTNFADAQSAAKNALNEFFNTSGMTIRELRNNPAAFTVLEETIDEIVPKAVEDRTSDFAETRSFGRDESVIFKIRTSRESKRRMYKALRKGARGGIYKAHRLDGKNLSMTTHVETVGYATTLEELLTGSRSVSELITILADAWVEKIYTEVVDALVAAAASAPAANKATSATTIDKAKLRDVISVISGYGVPVILGFRKQLGLINNTFESTVSVQDVAEVRARGYVGVFEGTPLVELPNYLIANPLAGPAQWLFTDGTLFILPSDEKPVKIAFQGESYTAEVAQPHGGKEWHNHRMMGISVMFAENIGSYIVT
jgi:hypothetical protein